MRLLYAVTIFLSAALLFLVQPMDLGGLAADPRWQELAAAGRVWTDDYSDPVRIMQWSNANALARSPATGPSFQ